jgi:hypothetical protein
VGLALSLQASVGCDRATFSGAATVRERLFSSVIIRKRGKRGESCGISALNSKS